MAYATQNWHQESGTNLSIGDIGRLRAMDAALLNATAGAADYLIEPDPSGGYIANAGSPLLTAQSGTDAAAVLQAAITALGTTGGTILFAAGSYTWSTIPKILPGGAGLRILGAGRATRILLSDTGQTFVGLNRTADHQTFQNLELGGFLVDNNGVTTAGNGYGLILSGRASQVSPLRVNYDNIYVHDIDAIDSVLGMVPASSTVDRSGIHLATKHLGDLAGTSGTTEATMNTQTNICIERVRVFGGRVGFYIGSSIPGSVADGLIVNQRWDNIVVRDCYHDTGISPTSNLGGVNFQIGSRASGGRILVENFEGRGSVDIGIEIDNARDGTVRNSTVKNGWAASYLATNFNPPDLPTNGNSDDQNVVFDGCTAIYDDNSVPQSMGFQIRTFSGYEAFPLGRVVYRDCKAIRTTTAITAHGSTALFQPIAFWSDGNSKPRHIIIDGFKCLNRGFNDTPASSVTMCGFYLQNAWSGTDEGTVLTVRNVMIDHGGANGGVGNSNAHVKGVVFQGGVWIVDWDGTDYKANYSGLPTTDAMVFDLGPSQSTTIAGRFRRLRITSLVGDTNTRGYHIRPQATLTIRGRIYLEDTGLSTTPAGYTQGIIYASGTSNAPNVIARNTRWRGYPLLPAAITANTPQAPPFAATTWTSATGNQYYGPFPGRLVFTQGTGAGITAIAIARQKSDGTADTYYNLWTQAAGALAQSVPVELEPGDFVKVTFATTQPDSVLFERRA